MYYSSVISVQKITHTSRSNHHHSTIRAVFTLAVMGTYLENIEAEVHV